MCVLGVITGTLFLTYVGQMLVPVLTLATSLLMDNLSDACLSARHFAFHGHPVVGGSPGVNHGGPSSATGNDLAQRLVDPLQ